MNKLSEGQTTMYTTNNIHNNLMNYPMFLTALKNALNAEKILDVKTWQYVYFVQAMTSTGKKIVRFVSKKVFDWANVVKPQRGGKKVSSHDNLELLVQGKKQINSLSLTQCELILVKHYNCQQIKNLPIDRKVSVSEQTAIARVLVSQVVAIAKKKIA